MKKKTSNTKEILEIPNEQVKDATNIHYDGNNYNTSKMNLNEILSLWSKIHNTILDFELAIDVLIPQKKYLHDLIDMYETDKAVKKIRSKK